MMNLTTLFDFLLYCSLINFSLLLWWFVFFSMAHDFMFRVHTRRFKLSVEQFDAIHYNGMAIFKIIVIVFNIVPLFALYLIR